MIDAAGSIFMADICDQSNFLSRQICDLRSCGPLRYSHYSTMPMEKHIEWLLAKVSEVPHGTKGKLAAAMGIDGPKLSKSLKGEREISASELEKAIQFFRDAPDSVKAPQRMVTIMGLAGAGPDGSVLYATGDGNFGETPAPEDATENTVALEVRGDSMRGMANDGWLIFYDEREPPTSDHMGEPCVCWLEDERILVKTPYPGRSAGLFDLESVNAPTMRDIPVRYFAFVTEIKPRRSAKKFTNNRTDHKPQDVSLSGKRI